jgi:hypothetical protein
MSDVYWARLAPWLFLGAMVGGVAVVHASFRFFLLKEDDGYKFAKQPESQLYFALVASTTGLSLGVGAVLFRRWLELARDVSGWAVAFAVALSCAAMVGVRVSIVRLAMLKSPLPRHHLRTSIAYLFTALGLLPALSGMILVAEAGASRLQLSQEEDARSAIPILVSSRNDLALFLASAAFVVAVAICATAALRRALIVYEPTGEYPASSLLLHGAVYSALLFFLFAPAYLLLQEASRVVVDVLAPVSGGELPFPRHEWFQLRTDLERLLGLDISIAGAFGAAFAVLTPVASSAFAAFLQDNPKTATKRAAE